MAWKSVAGVAEALRVRLTAWAARYGLRASLAEQMLACLLIAYGLWLPVKLVLTLAQFEEHVPSYDYAFYMPVLDRMALGEQSWIRLPYDCVFNGGAHCMVLPTVIRHALTRFDGWNIQSEIWLGFAFALTKVLLLTHLFAGKSPRFLLKGAVFVALSVFTFSIKHLSSYEFGAAGMNQHCADLAFLVGLTMFCHRPSRLAFAALLLGGIGASWSYGAGLAVWPAILSILFVSRYASLRRVLIWGTCAACALSPYVAYRVFHVPKVAPYRMFNALAESAPLDRTNAFAPMIWLRNIGVILSSSREMSIALGGCAVGACALAVASARLRRQSQSDSRLWACLALGVYAAGMLWIIVLGRGAQFAPWYSVHIALVWCTLIGLAAYLIDESPSLETLAGGSSGFADRWAGPAVVTAACIATVLMTGKRGYSEDCGFFHHGRTDVASSMMRNYRVAPNYVMHQAQHCWKPDFEHVAETARILERHGWNVFGPRRILSLQGDWGLDTVIVARSPNVPDPIWIKGQQRDPRPYPSFGRLNLCLHSPDSVKWTVKIPPQLEYANFTSAIARCAWAPAEGDGCVAELHITDEKGNVRTGWSQQVAATDLTARPFEVDLREYAGQRITLTLTSDSPADSKHQLIWEAPRIALKTDAPNDVTDQTVRPSNTDVSPAFVPPGAGDVRLDVSDYSRWQAAKASPVQGSACSWLVDSSEAAFEFRVNQPVRLREYPRFCIQVEAESELKPRIVDLTLFYRLGAKEYFATVGFPLVPDDLAHWYSIDQSKLGIPQTAELSRVVIRPANLVPKRFPAVRVGIPAMAAAREAPAGPVLARKPD